MSDLYRPSAADYNRSAIEGLRQEVKRLQGRIEAALDSSAQASVLLKQSGGDSEALKYVGLALKALRGGDDAK